MYNKISHFIKKNYKTIVIVICIVILLVLVLRLKNKSTNNSTNNSIKIDNFENTESLDSSKLKAFTVYKSKWPKVRLGRDYDGGYAIADIGNPYDYFLSGGIENDTSFEESFLKRYPNLECTAFDGTVDAPTINSNRTTF